MNQQIKVCISQGCGRRPYARGLCARHYFHIKNIITQGRSSWKTMEKEGKAIASSRSHPKVVKCLNPECESLASVRGLCARCYNTARHLVFKRRRTWDVLIKQNKILPSRPVKRHRSEAWLLDLHWRPNPATRAAKAAKCPNPYCEDDTKCRGLCESCYGVAARLVRGKATSWAKLEKAGKTRPLQKKPSNASWFLK